MNLLWKHILCSIFSLILAGGSDVFLVEPQKNPYFVEEGDSILELPCVIDIDYLKQEHYEISWARYYRGQLQVLTKNEKLLARKNSSYRLDYNPATGDYNLKISSIRKNLVEGTYHCNVIATDDSDVQHSVIATVIVLVPPGDPIIDSIVTESVIEGDFLSVRCISVGGSPQPFFTWILPNGTEATQSFYNTQTRDGATESVLHFRISAQDNGNTIRCDVANEAMKKGSFKTVTSSKLTVLYKPIVFVTPVENLTHISVEDGSFINLTCHATANPPPHSFEWKHLPSGERYQNRIWPIIINNSLSGEFECRSTNKLGEGKAQLEVIVQHSPEINLPFSINPEEKEEINIECKTKSVPEVMDIHWVGPNGLKMNGSHLIISSISKEMSGNYTCVATNFLTVYGQSGSQQRTNTRTMIIDVKREPGTAHISNAQQNVEVGGTIQLHCELQDKGNPRASYKWSSPFSHGIYGIDKNSDSEFLVRNAQLSDNGVYSCKGFNALGEGPANFINVTVIEKPVISSPLATERIFSNGDQNKTLDCEAEGYPLPSIVWLKNGNLVGNGITEIVQKSNCNFDEFCSQKIVSSLQLESPMQWLDKGNFTCIADNNSSGSGPKASSWTILHVLHKPVILKQTYSGVSIAGVNVGSRAIIPCKVSARPEPEFHWLRNGIKLFENEKYSFFSSSTKVPDEYEQTLQIENIQNEDFGNYVCRVTNGNGGDNATIELRNRNVPFTPKDLRKVSSTANSIFFSWDPQFNGGSNQTFTLETRKVDPLTGKVQEDVPSIILTLTNAAYSEEIEKDGTIKPRYMFNLSSLMPLTTYILNLRAENDLGFSNSTQTLVASTKDVFEDVIMMSPSRLVFDSENQRIQIEPALPSDACILLYVLSQETWRTVSCYSKNSFLSQIAAPNTYKARFCSSTNVLRCSPLSEQIYVGSSNMWKTSVLIPFAFFTIIGLSVCVFFAVCCKTRAEPVSQKLRLGVPPIVTYCDDTKRKCEEDLKETGFMASYEDNINKSSIEATKDIDTVLTSSTLDEKFHQSQLTIFRNSAMTSSSTSETMNGTEPIQIKEEETRVVREIIV